MDTKESRTPAQPLAQASSQPGAGVRAAVVRFPGSNCDEDSVYALERLGASVTRVWHSDTALPEVDLVILPGGFSYGDYLRSGAMAAWSNILGAVKGFAHQGGLVLGICNGFQLLTESGLLPGALARNENLHFVCEQKFIRVEQEATPFTNALRVGDVLNFPVAHGEGRYFADSQTLEALESEGRVLFRYCSAAGELAERYNPNGSLNHIACIISEGGNVCGLMPHPERAVEPLLGSEDGQKLFRSVFTSLLQGVTA